MNKKMNEYNTNLKKTNQKKKTNDRQIGRQIRSDKEIDKQTYTNR